MKSFFTFWYHKIITQFSFFIVFFALIGVLVFAYIKEINLEIPDETAPFSDTFGKPSILEDNDSSLAKPHRTNNEVSNFINAAVAETLNFTGNSYADTMDNARIYYAQSGHDAMQQYIASNNILTILKQRQMRLSVFAVEEPLLMNSQEIQGVYRWLYQVPLMINYAPINPAPPYTGQPQAVSQNVTLRVQVRRAPAGSNDEALLIETWQISAR